MVVANLAYDLQIMAVLSWIALLLVLQLAIWPLLRPSLRDYAYPAAFPVSIVAFTIISWYCGLLQVPIQAAVIPFLLLIVWYAWRGGYQRKYFSGQGKWALVFFVFFLFMLELRFVNPSISYAEKFMDHAFLASIMRDPVVPPLDPWFAGGTLDVYYYLGYWIFGALGLVTVTSSSVVFNLALPTVLANAAVAMFALAHLLCNRMRWLPLLTFLLVNPSFVWRLIQGEGIGSVLWDSTRTIPNAINEYPLFSFVWGDVHAHVISIFNQVLLLFLLVYSLKCWRGAGVRERFALIVLTALSLGSVPLINAWDVILYAPLTVFVGYLIWYKSSVPEGISDEGILGGLKRTLSLLTGKTKKRVEGSLLCRPWIFLLLAPVLSVVFYLPYYFQMNTRGIQGIGLVHTPTPVTAFLLVNGIFIAIFLLYLARDIVRRPALLLSFVPFALAGYASAGIAALPVVYLLLKKKRTPAELLAITGLLVIILAEFFYLKDNMGDVYYRMNTVFKFYLPAWIIMGASAFSMVPVMLEEPVSRLRITKGMKEAALIAVIAILLILPLAVPLDYQFRDATLDGLAYLDTAHPGDARAVEFLRSLEGVSGIVEAEGGDYTYYSRISSFTGIPTVIGMPFHEYMWRADGWSDRTQDVRLIYEDPAQTRALMERYNMTLVYVGDSEREKYQVRVDGAGLPLIYNQSGVRIYALSS
jgi:YYY domain-containing protein